MKTIGNFFAGMQSKKPHDKPEISVKKKQLDRLNTAKHDIVDTMNIILENKLNNEKINDTELSPDVIAKIRNNVVNETNFFKTPLANHNIDEYITNTELFSTKIKDLEKQSNQDDFVIVKSDAIDEINNINPFTMDIFKSLEKFIFTTKESESSSDDEDYSNARKAEADAKAKAHKEVHGDEWEELSAKAIEEQKAKDRDKAAVKAKADSLIGVFPDEAFHEDNTYGVELVTTEQQETVKKQNSNNK